MRCENWKKSRARRVAVRERERVFFPDGIRCSISEVVGAVIVEDRLLSLPLSPLTLSPDGPLRPTSLVSPKPSSTLAPKCPLRKPPRRRRISLPHSLTFPTTSYPPFSTVSGVIGCPSSLSLSPTAQACGTSKGVRSRTVLDGPRRSRRVGLRKVVSVCVFVCVCMCVPIAIRSSGNRTAVPDVQLLDGRCAVR